MKTLNFNDWLHSLNLTSRPWIENSILKLYEDYRYNKREFGEKFAKEQLQESSGFHKSIKDRIISFNS